MSFCTKLDCTVFVITRTMVRKRLPYRREIFSLLKRATNNCSTDGIFHLKDLPQFARLKQTFYDFMKIEYAIFVANDFLFVYILVF